MARGASLKLAAIPSKRATLWFRLRSQELCLSIATDAKYWRGGSGFADHKMLRDQAVRDIEDGLDDGTELGTGYPADPKTCGHLMARAATQEFVWQELEDSGPVPVKWVRDVRTRGGDAIQLYTVLMADRDK